MRTHLVSGLVLGLLVLTPRAAVAQLVPVQVTGERAGPLVLHHVLVEGHRSRWTGQHLDATRPVCAAPCAVNMAVGLYRFAVSDGTSEPHRHNRLLSVDRPLSLSIDYEDRSGSRVAGWAIFGAGAVAGAILAVIGALMIADASQVDLSYALMIGGLSTIATAGIISIPFVALQDHASVRVLGM